MGQKKRSGKSSKQERYECLPGYTKKQSKVIRGEINHADVNGVLAHGLLKAAIKNNDTLIMDLANKLLEAAHERSKEKNRKRAREKWNNLKNGTMVWAKPKSNKYTPHQKQVVRGEIPLENVHTKELIHIHLKAKENGDIELSERILSIIIDRRTAAYEAHMCRLSLLHERKSARTPIDYSYRDYLIESDYNILNGLSNINELPIDYLLHILRVCEKQGDEQKAQMARMLLKIKEHPESVYITQSHEEALNHIEMMMGRPIRRPETWFPK